MYEFCEDSAAQGVVYSEPRFSPQLASLRSKFSPEEAVKAAVKGMKRGQKDFHIKARIILCMVKGFSVGEWRPHPASDTHTHTMCAHTHRHTCKARATHTHHETLKHAQKHMTWPTHKHADTP